MTPCEPTKATLASWTASTGIPAGLGEQSDCGNMYARAVLGHRLPHAQARFLPLLQWFAYLTA